MKFVKSLNKLPVQLIISVIVALIFGKYGDIAIISIFYTISSCFIEILLLLLPLLIFGFIFVALVHMQRGSLLLLMLIFIGVTLSNIISLLITYGYATVALPIALSKHAVQVGMQTSSLVKVLFKFNFPEFFSTRFMLLVGICGGTMVNFLPKHNKLKHLIKIKALQIGSILNSFLAKVFIPSLPIYVFGFCAKLSCDKILLHLMQQYGCVFVVSMVLVVIYLGIFYFVGSNCNFAVLYNNLKCMLPAGLTAFSTMSSAATMPITINCTEEMIKDRDFADLAIPTTVNIHMLGDNLTMLITIMALAILFGVPLPATGKFIEFLMAFALAKLSCVGAPMASALVVLPVIKQYLNFTPEMLSLFSTIYALQDPFGTAANVLGNGGLALIIKKIFNKLQNLRK